MTKFNKLIAGTTILGILGGGIGSAQAALLLDEGFDTFLPVGWSQTNNSDPLGTTGWFAGNTGVFAAQAGAVDSYAAANFLNVDFGGEISNWLLTPELTLSDGSVFSFFTRTETGSAFPDRLEVRASTNGSSSNVGTTATSVGDFTNLLLTINPSLAIGGYPEDWTQYVVTLSGVGAGTQGQLAFRYFVTDTFDNANYIGIDTVALESGASVPEPSTLLVVMLGLAVLGGHLRREVAR